MYIPLTRAAQEARQKRLLPPTQYGSFRVPAGVVRTAEEEEEERTHPQFTNDPRINQANQLSALRRASSRVCPTWRVGSRCHVEATPATAATQDDGVEGGGGFESRQFCFPSCDSLRGRLRLLGAAYFASLRSSFLARAVR